MRRSIRPRLLHLLVAANLALLVFLFVQVPSTTRVRLVFEPHVPANLSAGAVSAVTEPGRRLELAESGGLIESLSWENLFSGGTERLAPPVMLPDGLLVRFRDPLWSFGAQRVSELRLSFPGLLAYFTVAARTDVRTTIRPQRGFRPDDGLSLFGDVIPGRDQTLHVDTAPLWFFVPTDAWQPYAPGSGDIRYGSPSSPPLIFYPKPPPAGVSLPYRIEDELTGVPLPSNVSVVVNARSVEADAVSRISLECSRSVGKMSASCWHELAVLRVGSCAAAWPVTVDGPKSVLHISSASGSAPDCDLIIGVVPAGADSPVHATVLKLFNRPEEAP